MFTKILFAFGFCVSAIIIVWYLSNTNVVKPDYKIDTVVDNQIGGGRVVDDSSGGVTKLPGTVASYQENPPSDSVVVENKDAKEIVDGFFEMTNEDDLYGVYYDEPSGSFTITLYGVDTKKARIEAESYITKKLNYTKEQWCSFPVTVITNEFENPKWAGINLGLSFCPGSVEL